MTQVVSVYISKAISGPDILDLDLKLGTNEVYD